MKTLPFWKMSGSGNDFVVVDNRRGVFPKPVPAWAKRLCFRQEGVGADGLLLLERSRRADFRMVYYNADGSRATMCGNGARCLGYFARAHGAAGACYTFETDRGVLSGRVIGSRVSVSLSDPVNFRPDMVVQVLGKTIPLHVLNTGVPHAVCPVRRVDAVDVMALGRALRFHRVFGKAGANVNFVERLGTDAIRIRTYERGVEGETLACGTGVAASAIAMGIKGLVQAPVECHTRGGDVLTVRFTLQPGNPRVPATGVRLEGPVRITFKGKVAM